MSATYTDDESFEQIINVAFFSTELQFKICVGLSLSFTLLMLLLSLTSKLYKEILGKMVFLILLADFFFVLPKLIAFFDFRKSYWKCNIMQAISHFGLISSFLWSACFGHALLTLTKRENISDVKNNMTLYISLAVLSPFLSTVISMYTGFVVYLDETNTCVHQVVVGQTDYQYILFTDVPLLLACSFSLFSYICAARDIRRLMSPEYRKEVLTLMVYPGILLLCWLPNLIVNAMLIAGIRTSTTLNTDLQVLAHLQGFLDALVYGGSRNVLEKMCKPLRRFRRKKNSERSDLDSTSSRTASLVNSIRQRAVIHHDKRQKDLNFESLNSLASPLRSNYLGSPY